MLDHSKPMSLFLTQSSQTAFSFHKMLEGPQPAGGGVCVAVSDKDVGL